MLILAGGKNIAPMPADTTDECIVGCISTCNRAQRGRKRDPKNCPRDQLQLASFATEPRLHQRARTAHKTKMTQHMNASQFRDGIHKQTMRINVFAWCPTMPPDAERPCSPAVIARSLYHPYEPCQLFHTPNNKTTSLKWRAKGIVSRKH
jgi:hypothetical protein